MVSGLATTAWKQLEAESPRPVLPEESRTKTVIAHSAGIHPFFGDWEGNRVGKCEELFSRTTQPNLFLTSGSALLAIFGNRKTEDRKHRDCSDVLSAQQATRHQIYLACKGKNVLSKTIGVRAATFAAYFTRLPRVRAKILVPYYCIK